MIKREVPIFLVVGGLTVLIDFLSYHVLLWTGFLGFDLCKAVSYLIGTIFAYFANRFWTFGHMKPASASPIRFATVYLTALGANVLVNGAVLRFFEQIPSIIQVAFLIATAVSATLNFCGMKFFVFNK